MKRSKLPHLVRRVFVLFAIVFFMKDKALAGAPVPITFHLFSAHQNQSDAYYVDLVCRVNQIYANSTNDPGLTFCVNKIMRPAGISNSCPITDPLIDKEVCTSPKLPGINVYLFGTSSRYLCGSVSNAVYGVIADAYTPTLLAHELGHVFGLSDIGGGGSSSQPGCGGSCQTSNPSGNIMSSNGTLFDVCQNNQIVTTATNRGYFAGTSGLNALSVNPIYQVPIARCSNGIFTFSSANNPYTSCFVNPTRIDLLYYNGPCPQGYVANVAPIAYNNVSSGGYYRPQYNLDYLKITYYYANTSAVNTVIYGAGNSTDFQFFTGQPPIAAPCVVSNPRQPKYMHTPSSDVTYFDGAKIHYIGENTAVFAIYDMLGRVIKSGELIPNAGFTVDVSDLQGIYVFSIPSLGYTYKIIK